MPQPDDDARESSPAPDDSPNDVPKNDRRSPKRASVRSDRRAESARSLEAASREAGGPEPGGLQPVTSTPAEAPLYFFPEEEISQTELQEILEGTDDLRRYHVVSCLLRYAQWDDIWQYVSRDQVREMFPQLDLPDNLRAAWGRMLKVEAVATR